MSDSFAMVAEMLYRRKVRREEEPLRELELKLKQEALEERQAKIEEMKRAQQLRDAYINDVYQSTYNKNSNAMYAQGYANPSTGMSSQEAMNTFSGSGPTIGRGVSDYIGPDNTSNSIMPGVRGAVADSIGGGGQSLLGDMAVGGGDQGMFTAANQAMAKDFLPGGSQTVGPDGAGFGSGVNVGDFIAPQSRNNMIGQYQASNDTVNMLRGSGVDPNAQYAKDTGWTPNQIYKPSDLNPEERMAIYSKYFPMEAEKHRQAMQDNELRAQVDRERIAASINEERMIANDYRGYADNERANGNQPMPLTDYYIKKKSELEASKEKARQAERTGAAIEQVKQGTRRDWKTNPAGSRSGKSARTNEAKDWGFKDNPENDYWIGKKYEDYVSKYEGSPTQTGEPPFTKKQWNVFQERQRAASARRAGGGSSSPAAKSAPAQSGATKTKKAAQDELARQWNSKEITHDEFLRKASELGLTVRRR